MAKGDKISLIMKYDYKDTFEALGPEQAYRLLMAVFEYDENGTLPDFTGELRIAWIPIRQDLDKNRANWDKTSEERAKAGALGGRGNKKEENKKSNCFSEKQTKAKKAKKAEYDCDCDSDCDLERENTAVPPAAAREAADKNTDDAGDVMAAYMAVKRYTELFGQPTTAQRSEIKRLVIERGYTAVTASLDRVGQRSPPPDEPWAYFLKVLDNHGEPWADTG